MVWIPSMFKSLQKTNCHPIVYCPYSKISCQMVQWVCRKVSRDHLMQMVMCQLCQTHWVKSRNCAKNKICQKINLNLCAQNAQLTEVTSAIFLEIKLILCPSVLTWQKACCVTFGQIRLNKHFSIFGEICPLPKKKCPSNRKLTNSHFFFFIFGPKQKPFSWLCFCC